MLTKIIRKIGKFAFADGGSIKAKVVRSGIWVGAGHIGLQLLSVIRSIALARLLTPDIFGLMALAMIVVRAIETFTRPGIAQALIARQQAFEEASATAFTLLFARGVLLSLILFAAAPWVTRFYEAQELELILQVLSAVFAISGLNNINMIARQKELDFRMLTYLSQATTVIGTIVTIVVAWWFRSVWALVVGQLIQASLTALLSYYFLGGRIQFAFNTKVARDLFSYGKFITAASIVTFVVTELDSAVIGKLLGTGQLGYYTLAITVVSLVTLSFSQIASGIMMPAFSKIQTDLTKLQNAYFQGMSLVVFLVMPASAGLLCLAEQLLYVIYGDKWVPAAVPLQILALVGVPRALLIYNGYLFEGIGKPKVAFQLGLLRLSIIAPIIIPMVKAYGLFGAAITVAIGGLVQWSVGLFYLRRYTSIKLSEVMLKIWRPLWTTLLMSLVVIWITNLFDTRTLIGLSTAVIAGIVTYVILNANVLLEVMKNMRGLEK